ncbi:MAG: sigma D regulator [Gammaproteobacteria bacterium]|nr:sigma D regulator [Gammaproteobacteria bacterium]MDH5731217.1 sigma D regulator [Gammaproteobacteria bacterium]
MLEKSQQAIQTNEMGSGAVSASEAKIERRTGSMQAINRLVEHRTEMLSLYGALASQRPYQKSDALVDLIQKFCQSLVDYTADAHFRLYRFIETNSERRMSASKVADLVYPRISASTQRILDFNDKYDTDQHCSELIGDLESDLSALGERLADRIELEDRIIDVLARARN